MLVLTRKLDEKIVIGTENPVTITILEVREGRVKIGFEGDAKIYREELLAEKAEALEPAGV